MAWCFVLVNDKPFRYCEGSLILRTAIFERIMKSSAAAGVRFVAVNRRDYPGSTPLTEEDLRVLQSGTDDERATFLSTQATQLATFIVRYIEQNRIPVISSDRKTGGILLLGWSLGCTFGLSILSNADAYPEAVRTKLALYLRSYVMFGTCIVNANSVIA